jgi:hypothetical protein
MNIATDAGAGIYVGNSAHLNVTDTMFTANRAQVKGGALAQSYNADVHARKVVFAANTARDWGGAVHLNMNATLVLDDADVHGNTATTGYFLPLFGHRLHPPPPEPMASAHIPKQAT